MRNFDAFLETLAEPKPIGKIVGSNGSSIRALLPSCKLGAFVEIDNSRAMVTGFEGEEAVLSLLDECNTLSSSSTVRLLTSASEIEVSEKLLGHVVDPLGTVLDQKNFSHSEDRKVVSISSPPIPFFDRRTSYSHVTTGVKALDIFTPLAEGQRIGLFAEPGVGKSTLTSMVAQKSEADVRVIALIGERAREAKEFLSEFDLSNTIFVVSTSSDPALMRALAAETAMTIAEYFASLGKSVLLQMDSLTRLFRAYREIGLASGEPAIRRGYPPSAYAKLPKLIERAGCFHKGSITAIFTVLLSSDLDEDPLVEEVKGILDGHIYLRSALAEKGVYPAFDAVKSLSRMASKVVSEEHLKVADELRKALSIADEYEEMMLFGGEGNEEIRRAIEMKSRILELIKQSPSEEYTEEELNQQIASCFAP